MMYTVYKVDEDIKYLFKASSPYNAMEKMLYTLNLNRSDAKAEIKETHRGYVLIHDSEEFWTRRLMPNDNEANKTL